MSKLKVVGCSLLIILLTLLIFSPVEKDYLQAKEGERLWSKIEREIVSALPKNIDVDIFNPDATPLTEAIETFALNKFKLNSDSNFRLVILTQQKTFRTELRVSVEQRVIQQWSPKKVFEAATPHIGWWSLLPLFILLASLFFFGKIYFSLVASLLVGGMILSNGNPIFATINALFIQLVSPLLSKFHSLLILAIVLFVGLISLISKLGGFNGLMRVFPFIKGRRGGQLLSISFAMFLFFDEYIRTITLSSSLGSMTKRLQISPEKVAFIINAFAAPLASLLIFTTWFFFQVEIFLNTATAFGKDMDVFLLPVKALPFKFYSLGILAFTLILAFTGREYGPMLKREEEFAKNSKAPEDKSHEKESKLYGVLPFTVLITFIVISFVYFSGLLYLLFGKNIDFQPSILGLILSDTPISVVLFVSVAMATIATLITIFIRKDLTLDETMKSWGSGVKSGGKYIFLLILAWGVAAQVKDLDSGQYLVALLNDNLSIWLVPFFLIFISFMISFLTGSALNAMSITLPLALPLVFELGGMKNLLIAFAAISDGAVLGQQISPISDTVILTTLGMKVDHIKNIRLSLPYVFSVLGIATLGGYLLTIGGMSPTISLLTMLTLIYGLIRYVGRIPGSKDRDQSKMAKTAQTDNKLLDSELSEAIPTTS